MKHVPKHLQLTWPCDRLVAEGLATITEVETVLSLSGVAHYIDVADFWHELRDVEESKS